MSEQLKHIFDVSACPTKRQMKEYLNGTMSREEVYAFEHHINSCLLCSEALDGLLDQKEEALAGISELNNNFLKDHLELHPPQIHLNAIAHASPAPVKETKTKTPSIWRPVGIAAALLICLGMGWYYKNAQPGFNNKPQIAQQEPGKQQSLETERTRQGEASSQPANENTLKTETKNSIAQVPPANKTTSSAEAVVSEQSAAAPAAKPTAELPADAADRDEVTVLEYKVPLTKKDEPDTKTTVTREEIRKLPSTSTNDVAALSGGTYQQKSGEKTSIGGARSGGTLYVTDDTEAEETKSKKAERKETSAANAEELFNDGKYSKALTEYKKQINSSDSKTSQRAQLMAARCYLNLGQNKNAEKLLRELSDNGSGAAKRQARRLLKSLGNNKD